MLKLRLPITTRLLPLPRRDRRSARRSLAFRQGQQPRRVMADSSASLSSATAPQDVDAEFGFRRKEFGTEELAGTVMFFERHAFFCYGSQEAWPSHLERSEADRVPHLLATAFGSRRDDLKKRTALTICEGEDGTNFTNGDVLIFPDMVRYRLTDSDIDTFIEEVLVKEAEWLPGAAGKLTGSYVFVCVHGSRDKRCGVCGPVLIDRFKEEIALRGLGEQVSVGGCSHIGGHKYAGNVIVFSPNKFGEVSGHWYGYVAPDDVPVLLDQHVGKGEIVDHLWRGQLGLTKEQQKEALELRKSQRAVGGCCQGDGSSGFTCCRDTSEQQPGKIEALRKTTPTENGNASSPAEKPAPAAAAWFRNWARRDTFTVLAVAATVTSLFVALRAYKRNAN